MNNRPAHYFPYGPSTFDVCTLRGERGVPTKQTYRGCSKGGYVGFMWTRGEGIKKVRNVLGVICGWNPTQMSGKEQRVRFALA